MQNLFVQSIFGQEILRALCWTLLHSCWQGLLLAMLTGLLILLTRRSKPALRYNLLAGTFVLFFLTTCLTFVWQLRSGPGGGDTIIPAGISPRPIASPFAETPLVNNLFKADLRGQWTDGAVNYLNEHAALIVAVWFLVFMVRLIKIMADLGKVQRVRHYRTRPAPAYWKERICQLAYRLRIKRPVALLESALIGVPMMAGVFKPVILVPMGLLAQLPPEQVEAILLHELAHIRRMDYFVNLLQSFAEILFFFNPAVLWLSSLIREERESCCDDIAVEQTSSKKEFIHALVSFQEYSEPGLRCALAFPGSGNHLLKRVKRIVHQDDKRLSGQEKWFLLICLLIAGGLTMAFSRVAQRSEKLVRGVSIAIKKTDTVIPVLPVVAEESSGMSIILRDTVPAVRPVTSRPATPANPSTPASRAMPATPGSVADTIGVDARENALRAYRRQQQELTEQQERLSEQQRVLLDRQKELTDRQQELIQRYKTMAMDGSGQQDELLLKSQKLNLENKMFLLQKRDMEKHLLFNKKRNKDEMLRLKKTLNIDERRQLEERLELEKTLDQRKLLLEKNQDQAMLKLDQGKLKVERDLNQAEAMDKLELKKSNVELQQEKMLKLELHKTRSRNMHEVIDPIIEDLLERKLITNREVLSFSLDKDGLIVNGVRQPDEIFVYFKEKYLPNPHDLIKYLRKADGEERITLNRSK